MSLLDLLLDHPFADDDPLVHTVASSFTKADMGERVERYAATLDGANGSPIPVVADGIDALIAQGIADPDHLYITGGSAGGIAAAYAIGLTDRFKAAVVAKPVVNWVSKVLTADSGIGQIANQFPGLPWESDISLVVFCRSPPEDNNV